jgi:hypothetical protein
MASAYALAQAKCTAGGEYDGFGAGAHALASLKLERQALFLPALSFDSVQQINAIHDGVEHPGLILG